MKKELDDYLVEKYPKIFINRYAGMKETAMCWGFDHGDGWFWLLDQLCNSIQSYIDSNEYRAEDKKIPQAIADQVKEKFGGLNFYYHGGDDYIGGMIQLAEHMSYNTCEFCGSTENVGKTNGWISVICKDCHTNSDNVVSQRSWVENKNSTTSIFSKELRKIKIDKLNK